MNPINNIMKLATDLAYCTDDEFGEIKVALRAAIEQSLKDVALSAKHGTPGEPVAWMRPSDEGYDSAFRDHRTIVACTGNKWEGWIPLYTHPHPDDTALLQQCLEALEAALSDDKPYIKECKEAVAAIKERLK